MGGYESILLGQLAGHGVRSECDQELELVRGQLLLHSSAESGLLLVRERRSPLRQGRDLSSASDEVPLLPLQHLGRSRLAMARIERCPGRMRSRTRPRLSSHDVVWPSDVYAWTPFSTT